MCVCVLGGEGADGQQQVGKTFQAATVRAQTDTERSTLTWRPHTPWRLLSFGGQIKVHCTLKVLLVFTVQPFQKTLKAQTVYDTLWWELSQKMYLLFKNLTEKQVCLSFIVTSWEPFIWSSSCLTDVLFRTIWSAVSNLVQFGPAIHSILINLESKRAPLRAAAGACSALMALHTEAGLTGDPSRVISWRSGLNKMKIKCCNNLPQ